MHVRLGGLVRIPLVSVPKTTARRARPIGLKMACIAERLKRKRFYIYAHFPEGSRAAWICHPDTKGVGLARDSTACRLRRSRIGNSCVTLLSHALRYRVSSPDLQRALQRASRELKSSCALVLRRQAF